MQTVVEKFAPVRLPANQPAQFYRGGAAIAALRGAAADSGDSGDTEDTAGSDFGPEDWVASTTARFGQDRAGLTTLPGGGSLRAAVHADPAGWLGHRHVETFADSTALLVKLLDAGQRLPVHFHPSDVFARGHFASHFGKHEAWVVLGTSGADPRVHVGFTTPPSRRTLREWVRDDPAPSMVESLNSVAVRPGDTVYIPAGLPHAIGAGVFVAELQQPTDLSLTLEWRDFLSTPEQAHLGIGFDTALEALDTSAWDGERLAGLINHTAEVEGAVVPLLTRAAERYFRADALRPAPTLTLDPGFTVLIVLAGSGELRTEHGGACELTAGETFVVPHGAGQAELSGTTLNVLRARPPACQARHL